MRTKSIGIFSRKIRLAYFAGAVAALPFMAGRASADEVFKAAWAVTGLGGQKIVSFDISFVDPAINRYLLADRTNKLIDIVDTTHNTVMHQIIPTGTNAFTGTAPCSPPAGANDCAGPNGVLTLNDTGGTEVWVGDGPSGTPPVSKVKVFALGGTNPTHTIPTGPARRPAELLLHPPDHLILMANDAETPFPFITFIATGGNKKFTPYTVVGKITTDGTGGTPKATNGIEQCQWRPQTGKFYLNIPGVNVAGDDSAAGAVLVVDPQTTKQRETC